ncbi:MAG: hypothetical protein GC159_10100 [Phycisphaera sp.]|nr:hypothetical protein [Phycisphaera sp.]
MRWLHVIEPGVSVAAAAMAADLIGSDARSGRDVEHVVCAVGAAACDVADVVGLRVDHRVAASATALAAGVGPVTALTSRTRTELGRAIESIGDVQRMHAWSIDAALLMRWGWCDALIKRRKRRDVPQTVSVFGPAPRCGSPALRRLLRHDTRAHTTLITADEHARDSWRAATAQQRGDAERVVLIEPGVDTRRLVTGERDSSRMRWSVNDGRSVVAVLSDPPQQTDALLAMLSVGIARETGRAFHMLIHRGAVGLERAARVVKAAGRGELMSVRDEAAEPWRSLGGCDMALALGGGVHLAWALAAGVPVVAHYDAAGTLLRHEDNALISDMGTAANLARMMCRLHDDPQLRQRLADAGRNSAERFGMDRFVDQMHAISGGAPTFADGADRRSLRAG